MQQRISNIFVLVVYKIVFCCSIATMERYNAAACLTLALTIAVLVWVPAENGAHFLKIKNEKEIVYEYGKNTVSEAVQNVDFRKDWEKK